MRVLRQDPTLCRRLGRSTNPQRQQLSKIKTSTSSWLRRKLHVRTHECSDYNYNSTRLHRAAKRAVRAVAEAQGMRRHTLSDRHVLIAYMYYISVFVLKKRKKSLGSQMTLYPSRKQEVRRPRRPVRGKVILGPSTFWLLSRSIDLLKKNLDPSIRAEESRFTEHAAPCRPLTDC